VRIARFFKTFCDSLCLTHSLYAHCMTCSVILDEIFIIVFFMLLAPRFVWINLYIITQSPMISFKLSLYLSLSEVKMDNKLQFRIHWHKYLIPFGQCGRLINIHVICHARLCWMTLTLILVSWVQPIEDWVPNL